jgi:hypothetical protein
LTLVLIQGDQTIGRQALEAFPFRGTPYRSML